MLPRVSSEEEEDGDAAKLLASAGECAVVFLAGEVNTGFALFSTEGVGARD